MTLSISIQVFSRFILSFSPSWSEELARYSMVYIIFLSSSVALRNQDLIAVEFLPENLPKIGRKLLKILINVIGIVFFIILLIKGVELIDKIGLQKSPAINIPMYVPYASIPIGSFFLILNAITVIIEQLRFLKGGEK